MYVYRFIYVHIFVPTHIYICSHLYICVFVNVCIYIHTLIQFKFTLEMYNYSFLHSSTILVNLFILINDGIINGVLFLYALSLGDI